METKEGLILFLLISSRGEVCSAQGNLKMNQMEHNVKIKDYKRDLGKGPLETSLRLLDYRKNFTSQQEQQRLMDRFKDIHWDTQHVLSMRDHQDRMYVLRHHASTIESNQKRDTEDYEHHRANHLQGIKDNINTTRERFHRRTELDRKVNLQENGPNTDRKPQYKIINDGAPIRY